MNGRGGACQVINLVNLDIQRKSDIMSHKLVPGMTIQMLNIVLCAGEQIVRANYLGAVCYQPFD